MSRNTAGRTVSGQLVQGEDGYWREVVLPKKVRAAQPVTPEWQDLQTFLAMRYQGLVGRERAFTLANGERGNMTAVLELAAADGGVLPKGTQVDTALYIKAHILLRQAGYEAGHSTAGRRHAGGHGHDIPPARRF